MIMFSRLTSCIFALFFFAYQNIALHAATLEAGVMGLSAASSMKNLGDDSLLNFKGIFTPEGDVEVENIIFSIDDDMKEKGAVTVYFVVCYDPVLLGAIKSDTASQFKNRIDTYKNDYPDKIVILKWKISAKKRVSPKIIVGKHYEKDNMSPVGGFIFVTYSTPGDHRFRIPSSWKEMKICLKRKDCKLEQIE